MQVNYNTIALTLEWLEVVENLVRVSEIEVLRHERRSIGYTCIVQSPHFTCTVITLYISIRACERRNFRSPLTPHSVPTAHCSAPAYPIFDQLRSQSAHTPLRALDNITAINSQSLLISVLDISSQDEPYFRLAPSRLYVYAYTDWAHCANF